MNNNIGGLSPNKLASAFGTPLYVLDFNTVENIVNRINYSFPFDKYNIYYSMKANPNPDLIRFVSSKGIGIDACSMGDIVLARKCGIPDNKITFTGVALGDDLLRELHYNDIKTNLDSISELYRWFTLDPVKPVGLRVAPDVHAGFSEHCRGGEWGGKLGIALEDIPQCINWARRKGSSIKRIHMHIGSGMEDESALLEGIDKILPYFRDYPELETLNIGGGIVAPYWEDDEEFPIEKFSENVNSRIKEWSKKCGRYIKLELEPGELLVGKAGWILTTAMVKKVWKRGNQEKNIVILDSSMNQFPGGTLYGITSPLFICRNTKEREMGKYTIYGNTNQSGDCFGDERLMPEIYEGDLLAIAMTGAYASSRAGNFNEHLFPPEVVCYNEKYKLSIHEQDYNHLFERMNIKT